jgi:outer membrane protein TolC
VAVIRAYFALLEAQRLRDVTRETIAVDRQQLENAQQRFTSGRLTKNELLVVQVALRNAEQRLLQRELDIDARAGRSTKASGSRSMRRPRSSTSSGARRSRMPTSRSASRRRTTPCSPRSSRSGRASRRPHARSHAAVCRASRPGGSIDYTTQDIVQPQRIGSGFVGFNWDLGTDGRREAAIAEARIAVDRNRLALERTLREIESAVRQTQRAAAERLAALATAEVAVTQAEENLRIRRQQFDAGRATSDDVLDATALLAGQRAVLATALYEAHVRRAELQELVGLPLDAVVADTR